MTFTYPYPMAAACGVILLYSVEGDILRLATTQRAQKVGGGRSLSAGGFYEIKDMFNTEAGTIRSGLHEIYREMREELGAKIDKFISYKSVMQKAEFLDHFMVHKGQGRVHVVTAYSMEVSKSALKRVANLSKTDEQAGVVIEELPLDTSYYPSPHSLGPDELRERFKDFLYPEEVYVAEKLFHKLSERHAEGYHYS